MEKNDTDPSYDFPLTKKQWAWVADDAEGYIVAEIVRNDGNTASVITLSGEVRSSSNPYCNIAMRP